MLTNPELRAVNIDSRQSIDISRAVIPVLPFQTQLFVREAKNPDSAKALLGFMQAFEQTLPDGEKMHFVPVQEALEAFDIIGRSRNKDAYILGSQAITHMTHGGELLQVGASPVNEHLDTIRSSNATEEIVYARAQLQTYVGYACLLSEAKRRGIHIPDGDDGEMQTLKQRISDTGLYDAKTDRVDDVALINLQHDIESTRRPLVPGFDPQTRMLGY